MIVLDTNVISELVRPEPAESVLVWVDGQDALATTAITVAELHYGVARLAGGARKSGLESAVTALIDDDLGGKVLAFDRDAAALYGRLVARRESLGRPISSADAQIAAICGTHRATLATRNVRDFDDTEIDIINPWADAG